MRWTFDERGSEEERMLRDGDSFEDVLRRARATRAVEAEELAAVESVRPTVPVFLGEPWR